MSQPEYQEFPPEKFPLVREPGREVRVLSGEYGGARGPIVDAYTELSYFDVRLQPNAEFEIALEGERSVLSYVFEGNAVVGAATLPQHTLAIFGAGERVRLQAGNEGARFILVSGRPLHEPIVQYGPFVMNTREEIEQALEDFRNGRLVAKPAEQHPANA